MIAQEEIWDALITSCENEEKEQGNPLGWSFSSQGFRAHLSLPSLLSANALAYLLKPSIDATALKEGRHTEQLPFEGMRFIHNHNLEQNARQMLRLYWPMAAMRRARQEKSFVIAHAAVSLDGKLATHCGDSKWIGNKENLVHAHRLRALVDAVLVGANTVKCDAPSLNVRHVRGSDPIRLILSNNSMDFSALQQVADSKTILLREAAYQTNGIDGCFDEAVYYQKDADGCKMDGLLRTLYQRGIRSLLVEGGARTTSSLFAAGGIDVLQIHYAPIIMGSGKSVIELPLLDKVADAHRLEKAFWSPMGDSFMVTARVV